jgi:hypothetical protein
MICVCSMTIVVPLPHSRLPRIQSEAFSNSSLQSILIPSNNGNSWITMFLFWRSLSSVTFEWNSHLTRSESFAFSRSSLQSVLIPSTLVFIASDAVDLSSQISLIDGYSCLIRNEVDESR